MSGTNVYTFAALFPPPKFLAMPAAGLDISDTSIKYMTADFTKAGFIPKVIDTMRLEAGIVSGGVVKDAHALAQALATLREKHHGGFVHVALPEELVYIFTLEVPKNSKREHILQTIEFALGEHVPIAAEDAVFDYERIGVRGDTMEISVTVFPDNVVEGYYTATVDAGFAVKSFELEAQSVARSVIPRGTEGVSMIIDFGRTRTGITIAEGSVPIFSTTIKVGGDAVTNAIKEHMGVSDEKADEMKRTSGLLVTDNAALQKKLLGIVTTLTDEVRRHYRFWETRSKDERSGVHRIERVFLCGGAVSLRGLVEHVASQLQVPVAVSDVWQNMFDTEQYIPTIPRTISWQYATVAGLALRDAQDTIVSL